MAFLVPMCYTPAVDQAGNIISGARGYIYQAGTTTTLQTYSDYALSSGNTIPYIVASSFGRFPPAYVANGSFLRYIVKSADGATTYDDHDNILAPTPSSTTSILRAYSTQTSSFGIDASMNGAVIGVDCTIGDIAVSANSSALGNGFWFSLQKINNGGGSIVVSGVGGSQPIDGASSYTIDTPYEGLTMVSRGGDPLGWSIVAVTSREEFGEVDLVEYTVNTTLQLSDKGKLIKMNSAGAVQLTVPPHATVPYAIGTRIDGFQYGAGEVTLVAGVGVTFRSAGGFLDSQVQYSGWSMTKIATNEWWLVGQLEA